MSVKNKSNKKSPQAKKSNAGLFALLGVVLVVVIAFIVVKAVTGGDSSSQSATASGGNLTIPKSEVSETAKFYPYKAGNTNMEVLAVKAPDGTIRTALNTCQVCFDSGRGYYKQEGDSLVCQNCGNQFKTSQVEKIKGGCNPVPILEEDKTDDGSNIVITKEFLEKNKDLFSNWKKQ